MSPLNTRLAALCAVTILITACGRPDTPTVGVVQQATLEPSDVVEQSSPQQGVPTEQQPAVTVDPQPTVTYETVDYVINVHSLEERTALAEIIVVGEITGLGAVFNSARDVSDNTKPATDVFSIGQEYTFRVQKYVKGEGPSDLTIVKSEGLVNLPPEKVTPQDIEQAKARDPGLPFQQGDTYLLFLNSIRIFDGKDYYYGAELPWRYRIEPDGQAVMDEPLEATMQMPQDLFSQPDKPFLAEVEQAVAKEQAR